MGRTKKILRSRYFQNVICWLGSIYIRFVYFTSSWKCKGREIPEKFWKNNAPFILCFWHGRLLMMPHCWDLSKTINLLTSKHRDGQLISKTVSHFGFHSIMGSSSKGGIKALMSMVKKLSVGECIGLTPDGPRGPRMRVSNGIISIARLSGAPIIPIAFSIDNGKILNTWDRFLFALPFGRGIFVWGRPIYVSRDADSSLQEKVRRDLEARLIKITNDADTCMGRQIIQPGSEPNRNDLN